ncbi:DUF4124 domain-containing protein [Thiorhodococcus minor]|uniref:DUF4124 domain-containing protein n=1 Tax=Thiorhodococcus minor TaxID=57489 RepID=A0A6M0K8F3_9GAMM|nr:DUF4124 domain-containing protein [Thiorhodococcus minor]NEV65293.1 DUF4124 domain-containing protein [Thiorhodococcus minor]
MTLAAILALSTSTGVAAGLYKCTDPATGAVTFSQTQCAADAREVDVDVHQPSEDEIARHHQRLQAGDRWMQRVEQERAARARARAAAQLEAARAAELAAVKAKRARAANNLAGATWEQALSQDEANINARYERQLQRLTGD